MKRIILLALFAVSAAAYAFSNGGTTTTTNAAPKKDAGTSFVQIDSAKKDAGSY